MLDLTCLGLTPAAVAVYRHLLEYPEQAGEVCHPETATALDLDYDTVCDALTELQQYLLLSQDEQGEHQLADPAIGIERLIEQRFTELNETLRRVAAARTAIGELSRAFELGRSRELPVEIERLEEPLAIEARLDNLAFFTTAELMWMHPQFGQAQIEAARAVDLRCLHRGLRVRAVVTRSAVADPLALAYLRELVGLGAEVRVSAQPLDQMVAFDRSTAVLPVSPVPHEEDRGYLVIRQPSLLASMVRLFEQIWAGAVGLAQLLEESAAERPTEVEREVLRILAEVDKDEVGARRMGVSLRTFRRHVAELMQRLDAGNRFHAALLAKERGWI
ncbi:helix-turn-helix transcriptional regulator [Streptomyces tateyamensis]|uniref:Helix-turn-helix transcriptional regulator n=1 Tax=Streptomyces tateyamensis TaxID=565073 RepID=A0A2V4NY72_9ACTN|nr:helix-turn-helix transcriptional regulator [Streptomyces tateyamensis]PYC67821.1 helix-turn-helix transcriptional regulator [Streptomyces tateyamensis]